MRVRILIAAGTFLFRVYASCPSGGAASAAESTAIQRLLDQYAQAVDTVVSGGPR